MIKSMSHACFYVLDQESAKRFYTEKLGFEVRSDVMMGAESEGAAQGLRWLTVSPPQPARRRDHPRRPRAWGTTRRTAEQIRALVAKGAIGSGVMATDDCQKTYEELSARGVVFLQEPAERPYGTEAVFRDDSGNWFSLNQRAQP